MEHDERVRYGSLIAAILFFGCGRVAYETKPVASDGGQLGCEMTDDFTEPGLGPIWAEPFAAAGTSIEESGGTLNIHPAPNHHGPTYAFYAVRFLDLRGGEASVKVVEVTSSTTSAELFLMIDDDVTSLHFGYKQGSLVLRVWDLALTPSRRDEILVPYDAAEHRYFRIRNEGADTVWETSPDGTAWTERRRLAVAFDWADARVRLSAGTFEPVAEPGIARFDDARVRRRCPIMDAGVDAGSLDGGSADAGVDATSDDGGARPCALEDGFDVAGRDVTVWATQFLHPSMTLDEAGGTLNIQPAIGVDDAYAGYNSTRVDMRGGEASVEMVEVTSSTSWAEMWLELDDGASLVAIGFTFGRLYMRIWDLTYAIAARDETFLPYAAGLHRFIRIRHDGADAVWETSGDGVGWTERRRAPIAFDWSNVEMSLFAGTWQPETTTGTARFDDARIAGACP